MRRFASAFVKGRDKKTSSSSSASLNTAETATTTATTTTTSTANTTLTSTSASDSSTSSIKYDESTTKRPSWKSWLSRSTRSKPTPVVWTPVADPAAVVIQVDDDDDDGSSELSTPFSPLLDPDVARRNFQRTVTNALEDSQIPPSPFVQPSGGPLFPRSINSPSLLAPSRSLITDIQRRQLLSRLESQVDVSPILPFAARQPPPIPASHPSPNDISRPSSKLSPASVGIQRWINRPCFEDRYLVYVRVEDGHIDTRPVTGTTLAIAALEYSEHLDVMADPDFDQPPSKHGNGHSPPPSTSHASISESSSATASTRSNTSYITAPSPLRNQHSPPHQPATVAKPASDQSKSQTAIKSTVKRVVRFAEDDSDGEDGLPLHIVRMKKKREQKAQFLRQEQLRRAKQQEEDRRRREQEALEKERARLELERERKERERERQEREKALYAETVAAARMRRDMQRAGGPISSNTTSSASLLVPSTSFTSLKESERNKPPDSRRFSSRSSFRDPSPGLSVPRREASDSALHLNCPPVWTNYLTDSSPSSSRPPSLSHSPISPIYTPNSRPPSTYSAHSSSSEDARRGGSKRNSVNPMFPSLGSGGSSSSFHLPPVMIGYPTWMSGGYIPPVPPFPEFANDMPLLPPTAPFMRHDKRSRNSSPGGNSTSSESRRGSFTSSTERLDRPPTLRAASNPVPRRDGSSSGHSRQPSGDSSRTHSTQTRPPHPAHKSQPVVSRGRNSLPASHSQNQYLQAPSPWSALPSQFGTLPTSMPWSSSQIRQSQTMSQMSPGGKQQRRQQTYPLS